MLFASRIEDRAFLIENDHDNQACCWLGTDDCGISPVALLLAPVRNRKSGDDFRIRRRSLK